MSKFYQFLSKVFHSFFNSVGFRLLSSKFYQFEKDASIVWRNFVVSVFSHRSFINSLEMKISKLHKCMFPSSLIEVLSIHNVLTLSSLTFPLFPSSLIEVLSIHKLEFSKVVSMLEFPSSLIEVLSILSLNDCLTTNYLKHNIYFLFEYFLLISYQNIPYWFI